MSDNTIETTFELLASTEYLATARKFLLDVLHQTVMPEKDARAVVLAVDEALANTIEHGYDNAIQGTITLRIVADPQRFAITIVDQAKQYNTASRVEHVDVDMHSHVNAGKRRGLGLFIMRKVMDEVRYAYRDGKSNELTLVKYIRSGQDVQGT